MSPVFRAVIATILGIACLCLFIAAMTGCATVPRKATAVIDCATAPCTIVDTKPAYHTDQDDPNSCKSPERKRACTEL